jgi:hypothetical protein
MGNAILSDNLGKSSEISSLTHKVSDLTQSFDFWNHWMLWGLGFAAIAAFWIGITTRMTVVRSKQLTVAQGNLDSAKEAQLRIELKDKDQKIADAFKASGEANERAGHAEERAAGANERSAALEVEALRLRKQLVAQGPRESMLRGEARQRLVDALKPFAGQRVDFRNSASIIQVNGRNVMSTPIGDDTVGLAVALIGVAKDAGWETPSEPLPTFVVSQGIEIMVSRDASERTLETAIALGHSLQNVPFEKVLGPVFADANRIARTGSAPILPALDKDTIVVEILGHP